jgi:hypothetical protein
MRLLRAICVLWLLALPATAADYTIDDPPSAAVRTGEAGLERALSRYLVLEMIRATFDVVPQDDLARRVDEQARRWGRTAPGDEAAAEIDRQLLAEASYYLVSLSYVIQVGGAAFPADRAEAVYANDTLVRIESLQRQLGLAIADGGEVLPIMQEAERIRALTEGNSSVPADLDVFGKHGAILAEVMENLARETRT